MKRYSELILIPTFEERFRYLKLGDLVGNETFGHNRYLNQNFYRSKSWRDFRRHIIIRDYGCDLGIRDRLIHDDDTIHIHHLNPLTLEQILDDIYLLIDEENVITTRAETHRAIHYGNEEYLMVDELVERHPFDTCPWKKGGK